MSTLYGQGYTIKGKVIDKKTKEPVSFANVFIKGLNIGTSANEDGFFTLTLFQKYYSLVASMMSYKD